MDVPASCLDMGEDMRVECSKAPTAHSGNREGKHGTAETTGRG